MLDAPASLCPDTSRYSVLHWLSRRRGPGSSPLSSVSVYLVVVALTYVPLFVAAELGPVALWGGSRGGPLTFLHDWGLGYALLVSLPSLVVLLVSDEQVLSASLGEVQRDGVIVLSKTTADTLKATWNRRLQLWNLGAQLLGLGVGVTLGLLTVRPYRNPEVASWIAPGGHLGHAGYVYLYCIILLYTVVIVYVTRCVLISCFLRALVEAAPLRILPLHPDRCGGLRPVGRLGLRNQYTLSVLGINIILLLAVWMYLMHDTAPLRDVMIGAAVAYLILGPIIFMAPLLPFRAGMRAAKTEWTHEVARVVRVEIDRLRVQLGKNEIAKPEEESIERLRKVGEAIDELPIWPFDSRTLRSFATAYMVPVALPFVVEMGQNLLKAAGI
jgi:hypothetical protein